MWLAHIAIGSEVNKDLEQKREGSPKTPNYDYPLVLKVRTTESDPDPPSTWNVHIRLIGWLVSLVPAPAGMLIGYVREQSGPLLVARQGIQFVMLN